MTSMEIRQYDHSCPGLTTPTIQSTVGKQCTERIHSIKKFSSMQVDLDSFLNQPMPTSMQRRHPPTPAQPIRFLNLNRAVAPPLLIHWNPPITFHRHYVRPPMLVQEYRWARVVVREYPAENRVQDEHVRIFGLKRFCSAEILRLSSNKALCERTDKHRWLVSAVTASGGGGNRRRYGRKFVGYMFVC